MSSKDINLQTQNVTTDDNMTTQTTTKVDPTSDQQFPQLLWTVPRSTANNNMISTHNIQNTIINSPRTTNSNNFKEHEWEMQLSIAKTYAEMEAKGNPEVFLNIMNKFLVNNGLSPVIIHNTNHSNNHSFNSNPPSLVSISPLLFSEAVTQGNFNNKDTNPPITPVSNSSLISKEAVSNKSSETAPIPYIEQSLSPILSADSQSSLQLSNLPPSQLNANTSDSQMDFMGTSLNSNIIVSHNADSDSPPQIHIPASTNSSNSQFSLRLESSTNTEGDRTQISPASSQTSLASAGYSEHE